MDYPKWTSSAAAPKPEVANIENEINVDLKELLKGKRVALVGPSSHIVGKGLGDKIDSYDIVVRIGQFFQIPEKMYPDLGKKTNIVAHSFNQFQIPKCNKTFLNSIDMVMCCMSSNNLKNQQENFFKSLTTKYYNINDDYFRKICKETGTAVNSGFAAIVVLLQYEIKELFITGYSFYNMGKYGDVYYDEYEKEAKSTAIKVKGEPKNITPKQARSDLHNQKSQIERFSKLIEEYDVISLDDFLTQNFKK